MSPPVLVTGAAGFIGFHVARRLLELGTRVVGVDNLNDYYDPRLKQDRLAVLQADPAFRFICLDLADRFAINQLFASGSFAKVLHFAAQAGVRHSLADPHAYAQANLVGFLNVLEACRQHGCEHLIYASSSSVYGANTRVPFSTADNVDHPLNLYGATKKANELMAHAYAHLFSIPTTGLRFFTVYGPWGRPDMAIWLFTAAMLENRPIRLFGEGRLRRDFTYIDDVTTAVVALLDHPPQPNPSWSGMKPDPASSFAPWRVYNIGNNTPVEVNTVVRLIEEATGKSARREPYGMQPGDMIETCADVSALMRDIGFAPSIPIEEGIRRFVNWYRDYDGSR